MFKKLSNSTTLLVTFDSDTLAIVYESCVFHVMNPIKLRRKHFMQTPIHSQFNSLSDVAENLQIFI